ncbi:hypothetical protein ASPFODRAFT_51768 [Aspergillus luchuensis CBS 106.47]|uniref:Uncharacterized protein n=1 Tax=Aspergillus luchuensis (strain CBS 106.47) TaxID=1137211 RepID=A0A1M3T5P4_ASPLC|nr:hypothetical protein ASPFODRAFT_51768 [Aspergillus luchuensis CBS 106.47]
MLALLKNGLPRGEKPVLKLLPWAPYDTILSPDNPAKMLKHLIHLYYTTHAILYTDKAGDTSDQDKHVVSNLNYKVDQKSFPALCETERTVCHFYTGLD